jgi:hypothetical protein
MRSRMLESLRTAVEQEIVREFRSDVFEPPKPLSPEETLNERRSELRNGLTDISDFSGPPMRRQTNV